MESHPKRRSIPLAEWAEREGIGLRTAQRMFHKGEIADSTHVDSKGHFWVTVPEDKYPATPPSDLARIQQQLNRIENKLNQLLCRV